MKNFISLIFCLLITLFSLNAQEKTLFSGDIESGGYGAFFTKIGPIADQTGYFVGGKGAWLINHTVGIGGGGYGLTNPIRIDGVEDMQMQFGCGGFMLEFIINSDELVHFDVSALIGGGGLAYEVFDASLPYGRTYTEHPFFMLEPSAHLVLNVSHFFRIAAGGSYRHVNGVTSTYLSDNDLSGFSGEIVFMFGLF
jgi:hypothetical protein